MRAIAPLLAALVLGACGAEPEQPPRPRELREAGTGRLEVRMALPRGPVYVEGSVPVVRIERLDGDLVLERETPVETLGDPLLARELRAGSYVVDVVQRPCQGNCGFLDPPDPASRCDVRVAVREGRTSVVEVRLRPGAAALCAATPG